MKGFFRSIDLDSVHFYQLNIVSTGIIKESNFESSHSCSDAADNLDYIPINQTVWVHDLSFPDQ